MAIGNDYNDQDLLEWAGNAFVTANSPAKLKGLFRPVAANDEGGVAEAIHVWMEEKI